MALPILDMALAIVRRTRRGESPWKPDALHLHHQMLRIGHSHRRAVALLYLWSGLIALGAVSFAYVPVWVSLIGIVAVLALAVVLTWGPSTRRPVS